MIVNNLIFSKIIYNYSKIYQNMLKTIFIFLAIFAINFAAVIPGADANAEIKADTSAPAPVPSPTLQGSYRLRLPFQPFRIQGNQLILSICNTHVFDIKANLKTGEVKITLKASTKIGCEDDYDQLYIDLFTSVTSFELDGRLTLKKDGQFLATARRKVSKWATPPKDWQGRWQLQIPNLALQVSKDQFVFEGCNTNMLDYKISGKGQIALTFVGSTKIGCVVDNDRIFVNALERSKLYQLKPVAFDLFDKNGEDTAYGTPYLK